MPLGVALLAVLGTFVVLTLLAKLTTVSVFSLNLATGLGLGLAIDYSLFVVSRYREELAAGVSPPVAIGQIDADRGPHRRVQRGHGRDFADVAGDLPGSVSPIVRVRWGRRRGARGGRRDRRAARQCSRCSGPRVEKFRLFKVRESTDGGPWRRQAERVMRHPVPYACSVSLVLVAARDSVLPLASRVSPTTGSGRRT